MITKIRFSSSIRLITTEYSFIDVTRDHPHIEISFNADLGLVKIVDTNFPEIELITTMANVVYFIEENYVQPRAELCTENSLGANSKESKKDTIQNSGRKLSETGRGNKRSK